MAKPNISEYLHLPLTLQPSGFLERAGTEEDLVGRRLRVFVLSGVGEYLRLPSPGIRSFWIQLISIGVSSRLRDVLDPGDERTKLEEIILEEVNHWLGRLPEIQSVEILGDLENENGIAFR